MFKDLSWEKKINIYDHNLCSATSNCCQRHMGFAPDSEWFNLIGKAITAARKSVHI